MKPPEVAESVPRPQDILWMELSLDGLLWLASRPGFGNRPLCLTFIYGSDVDSALRAFGAEPAATASASTGSEVSSAPEMPTLRIGTAGNWIFALEEHPVPQGTRPEVLRRISAETEAVTIFHEIAKGNHEFAHARDGEVITAVTTSVPPQWHGTQPDRLKAVAEELGLQNDTGTGFTDIEVLLALSEGVFGLSLDEETLERPWPSVPVLPVLSDLPDTQSESLRKPGDPVLGLLLERVSDDSLPEVLSRRLNRPSIAEGLNDSTPLTNAVRSALTGDQLHVTDDDPIGVALRRAALRQPEAARIIRLMLARRLREALTWDIQLHESSGGPAWRQEFVSDLGTLDISPDDRHAAEEAAQRRTTALTGIASAAPVRTHVQALLDSGMDQAAIRSRAGMSPVGFDRLMSGSRSTIPGSTAQRILAIEIPPADQR